MCVPRPRDIARESLQNQRGRVGYTRSVVPSPAGRPRMVDGAALGAAVGAAGKELLHQVLFGLQRRYLDTPRSPGCDVCPALQFDGCDRGQKEWEELFGTVKTQLLLLFVLCCVVWFGFGVLVGYGFGTDPSGGRAPASRRRGGGVLLEAGSW